VADILEGLKWYHVEINPEPWAVGPVGTRRLNGKMSAYVGRNQQLAAYQEAVREELGDGHEMIEGRVRIVFLFWRNRAEYETVQARTHRKHEADVTNLQKATEDALQGVLFKNDKNVNDIHSVMVEQGPDVRGMILIGIAASPEVPDVVSMVPDYVWELVDGTDQLAIGFGDDSSSPDTTKPLPGTAITLFCAGSSSRTRSSHSSPIRRSESTTSPTWR
jgi:Holliday junction resolvase RusA-like endonuclease